MAHTVGRVQNNGTFVGAPSFFIDQYCNEARQELSNQQACGRVMIVIILNAYTAAPIRCAE